MWGLLTTVCRTMFVSAYEADILEIQRYIYIYIYIYIRKDRVGRVSVFLNGIKLLNGTDFVANNGTSVVLSAGVLSTDRVEFQIFA